MVSQDIKRFVIRGHSTGKPIKTIGSPEIEQELISSEKLTEWAHLTIRQRCLKIKKQYGVDVNRHKLMLFYKRRNVRYLAVKSRYYPHTHKMELLTARRIEFAMKL